MYIYVDQRKREPRTWFQVGESLIICHFISKKIVGGDDKLAIHGCLALFLRRRLRHIPSLYRCLDTLVCRLAKGFVKLLN